MCNDSVRWIGQRPFNECNLSITIPTTTAGCRTADSSHVDENRRDYGDSYTADVCDRLSLYCGRLRQASCSSTMTAHGIGMPIYLPSQQYPSPWSPYDLFRGDETSRALRDIELYQLLEAANGKEFSMPERDLDLSD